MLDRQFIYKKLEMLSGYTDTLERFLANKDIETIKKDEVLLPAIERYFQMTVDSMLDINIHIIRENNLGAPDELQSTFKQLGEFKVLDKNFAEKIAPIVGARNMLVHRYDKLDKNLFLRNLQNNFPDFQTYLKAIQSFINLETKT
ncbi:MAG: DUF86 domain-containing protein [Candidatus Vogelbacteria bacterium]|nr:DUF86 domain-containing protein [Candidatus Vogelbacteria bacterium]